MLNVPPAADDAVPPTGTGAVAVPVGNEAADAWEPGTPSLKAMAPGALFGGLLPFIVYQLVHPHLSSQVVALLIAGTVPCLWVGVLAVVQRRIEPVGLIVFVALIFGAIMAASGGGPYAFKARDGAFAALSALVCFASLGFRRPIMFHLGKSMSAGNDPEKMAAFDTLWDLPTGARTFRVITVAWGVGLLVDAVVQLVLDAVLPTSAFLVADPVTGGVLLGGLFGATVWYSRRARRLGEEALAGTGITYPSLPRR